MPRIVDPSTVSVGNGLAANQSVGAHSLVQPTAVQEPLRAHTQDPMDAHMASTIGIVDAGAHFAAENVEGALQEIGSSANVGFVNGVISACTWTSVGLVLTLDANSTVMLRGAAIDYSGVAVTLNNGVTEYVYIHGTTGVLTVGVAPTLAAEHILISEVTTAGGVVTASRDGRFFIPDVQRKPAFTLRTTGAAVDQTAEGSFHSLTAALLWLELFAPGGETETRKIVVRGATTISSTVALPVDNICFEGEGDGGFVTGAALSPMFDLNGKSGITFRNLTFTANHTPSTAVNAVAQNASRFLMEDCRLVTGTQVWNTGVVISHPGAANTNNVIRRTEIVAVAGAVNLNRPQRCLISQCIFTGTASTPGGSAGIVLSAGGVYAGEGNTVIENTTVDGFETGLDLGGSDEVVQSCQIKNNRFGIQVTSGYHSTITDCTIYLDSQDGPGTVGGESGILIVPPQTKVRNCHIENPRGTWAASVATPYGISAGAGAFECQFTGNTIIGFFNSQAGLLTGTGIALAAGGCDKTLISDNTIKVAEYGVGGTASNDVLVSNVFAESVRYGAFLVGGSRNSIEGSTFILDSLRGENGIYMNGPQAIVTGTQVETLRVNPNWGAGDEAFGIILGSSADDSVVDSCIIKGFYNDAAPSGQGIRVVAAANRVTITNNQILGCWTGCYINQNVTGVKVLGNTIDGQEITVNGIQAVATAANAITNLVIADNTLRACYNAAGLSAGIRLTGQFRNVSIQGNTLDMFLAVASTNNPTADGIVVESGAVGADIVGATVSGNVVSRCASGILFIGTGATHIQNVTCNNNTVHHCGFAQDLSGAMPDTFLGRGSKGIGLTFTDNSLVQGNNVYKIGILIDNADAEAFPNQGAAIIDVQSKGIYARNCDQTYARDNTLMNMMSTGNGVGNGVYVEYRSYATGGDNYFQSLVVSGNGITWDSGLVGNGAGDYGVYVEAMQGTDTQIHSLNNFEINQNNVRFAARTGIGCFVGDKGWLSTGVLQGNTIYDVGASAVVGTLQQGGIVVQGIAATDAATYAQLLRITISGNQVYTGGQDGIVAYADRKMGFFRGMLISNNSLTGLAGYGVRVETTSNMAVGGSLDLVDILDNQVRDTGTGGIYVFYNAAVSSGDAEHISIQGNKLWLNAVGWGIDLTVTPNLLTDAKITENTITGSGDGINVTTPTLTDLMCNGNTVDTVTDHGIYILATSTNITNAVVSHNNVREFGDSLADTSNYGIYVTSAALCLGLSLVGNTVSSTRRGAIGMLIGPQSGASTSISVANNNILMTGVGGAPGFPTGFQFDQAGVGTLQMSSFTGNNVSCNASIVNSRAVVGPNSAGISLSSCTGNTSDGSPVTDTWSAVGGGAGGFSNGFTATSVSANEG